MGCGASKGPSKSISEAAQGKGDRHDSALEKSKKQSTARNLAVKATEEKKALDRTAALTEIYSLMDKNGDGNVDLCASSPPRRIVLLD